MKKTSMKPILITSLILLIAGRILFGLYTCDEHKHSTFYANNTYTDTIEKQVRNDIKIITLNRPNRVTAEAYVQAERSAAWSFKYKTPEKAPDEIIILRRSGKVNIHWLVWFQLDKGMVIIKKANGAIRKMYYGQYLTLNLKRTISNL